MSSGASNVAARQIRGGLRGWYASHSRYDRLTLTFAGCWLVFLLLIALFAHWISPFDVRQLDLASRLQPPVGLGGTWPHALGTDELGRDVLSRLLQSIQMSVLIALGATVVSSFIGVTIGFTAAASGKWVDETLSALIDAQGALPFVVLALAGVAIFGHALLPFILLLGFYRWEKIARLARGLALSGQVQAYVQAVRGFGAGQFRIYGRHVLPNAAAPLIVTFTLHVSEVILLETGLSFLGLGVQPPTSSLGNMVGFGRSYLFEAPWILLAPCAVIALTAWSLTMIGDALQQTLSRRG